MIDTREIFDDIHESLAVQQYGEEVAALALTPNALMRKREPAKEGRPSRDS
ncbi:MAG: hypothetical protein MUF71_03055 [Candidatus Kapabacteria bacterium]|jgi:hypothetical protein|nr:hypothetical protein [Candidatus Kapabacteria bacterium]